MAVCRTGALPARCSAPGFASSRAMAIGLATVSRRCGRRRPGQPPEQHRERHERLDLRAGRAIRIALVAQRAAVLRHHEVRQHALANLIRDAELDDRRRMDVCRRALDRLVPDVRLLVALR